MHNIDVMHEVNELEKLYLWELIVFVNVLHKVCDAVENKVERIVFIMQVEHLLIVIHGSLLFLFVDEC